MSCSRKPRAIPFNYVFVAKYEMLAPVCVCTHTHTRSPPPSAGYDVIAEDEILALLTLEMILTVERNIHQ